MKKILLYLGGTVLLLLLFSSCASANGGGPHVWIDQPLEAYNPHPLEPVTLQAHASDSDGVARMEFFVDGENVFSIDTGGERLGQAAALWNPPSPGTYRISVRGVDGSGQEGNPAVLTLIVTDNSQPSVLQTQPATQEISTQADLEEPLQTDSLELTATPSATEPPPTTETSEEEPALPPQPVAEALQNSNCREGPASAYNVEAILLEGETAPIVGKSADHSWLVVSVDDGAKQCWIAAYLVEITGNIDQIDVIQPPPIPITVTPSPTHTSTPTGTPTATGTPTPTGTSPPPPPPPPSDTTPPTITSIITFFPNPIYHGNCPDDPTTSSYVLNGVYDEGGVAYVEAAWTLGSQGGTVVFQTSDGINYGAIFGPFYEIGDVTMNGSVVDNAGNWTPFTDTLMVKSCID